MASVKISALPQQYTTTLNDVLAIVDSGNTLTSKVALSTIYQNSGSTLTSSPTRSLVIAGKGDIDGGNDNGMLAVQRAGSGVAPKISEGVNTSAIIASWRGVNIKGGGERNAVISTEDYNINAGFNNTVIGSGGNGNLNGGYNNTHIGTNAGSTNSSNTRSMILNGLSNSINTLGSNDAMISNSKSSTITFNNANAEVAGIYNSVQCGLYPEEFNHAIFNSIYSTTRGDGLRNQINNSYTCLISGSSNPTGIIILNSNGGKVQGAFTGQQNAIINSTASVISGDTVNLMRNNTIIGSNNIKITGDSEDKEYVTVIGVETPSSTVLKNNTTYVDNIHTYRIETFDVIDAGNVGGSIIVNCSLGTIYQFTMTANTSVDFQSITEGQRFIFIVYNSSNYTVGAMTVNGVGSTVYAKGGSVNPTNSGYTKYTATYVGGKLWLDEELNFQAI